MSVPQSLHFTAEERPLVFKIEQIGHKFDIIAQLKVVRFKETLVIWEQLIQRLFVVETEDRQLGESVWNSVRVSEELLDFSILSILLLTNGSHSNFVLLFLAFLTLINLCFGLFCQICGESDLRFEWFENANDISEKTRVESLLRLPVFPISDFSQLCQQIIHQF